jgi:hypothetical protein
MRLHIRETEYGTHVCTTLKVNPGKGNLPASASIVGTEGKDGVDVKCSEHERFIIVFTDLKSKKFDIDMLESGSDDDGPP